MVYYVTMRVHSPHCDTISFNQIIFFNNLIISDVCSTLHSNLLQYNLMSPVCCWPPSPPPTPCSLPTYSYCSMLLPPVLPWRGSLTVREGIFRCVLTRWILGETMFELQVLTVYSMSSMSSIHLLRCPYQIESLPSNFW